MKRVGTSGRGCCVQTDDTICVTKKRYKNIPKSIFCLCAIVSACVIGCGGDNDKDETTCDCTTGENCNETEQVNCQSQNACNCITGENCNDTERANCQSQKTCDCATGENCNETELSNCQNPNTCDCTTGENCNKTELENCQSQQTCDCSTGENCDETELANCQAQKTCGDAGCPDNMTCQEGMCVETACINKTCEDGTQCRDGQCIEIACLGIVCESNQVCKKGECVSDKCKDITCGDGYKCNDSGNCETTLDPIITIQARVNAIQKSGEDKGAGTHEKASSPSYFDIGIDGVQPTKDVIFTIVSSNTDEIKVLTSEVTFTPENWNNKQYFEIIGVPDNKIDGDQDVTLTITSASQDPIYTGLTKTIKVVNHDDDFAHLVINAPESLITTEGNFCKSFNDSTIEGYLEIGVKLGSKPESTVYINAEIAKQSNGYVENGICINRSSIENDTKCLAADCPRSKSFAIQPDDWDNEVKLKIMDQDDVEMDGTEIAHLLFKTSSYQDGNYNNLDVETLTFYNIDNDVPLLIPKVNVINTWDNGNPVNVCIKLNRYSPAEVTVTASVDTDKVVVDEPKSKKVLESAYTCFTIHGVNEETVDEDTDYHVTFEAKSDGAFNGVKLVLDAVNHNTEIPGVSLSDDRIVLDEGQSVTFKAMLNSKPSAQVKFIPRIPDNENGKIYVLDKTEYIITPDQWDKGVDIKLTAKENPAVSHAHTISYAFEFETASDDANYAGLHTDLSFKINDVNSRTMSGKLEHDAILSEADHNHYYIHTIKFDYKPDYDTMVTIVSSDTSELKMLVHEYSNIKDATTIDGGFRFTLKKDDWNTDHTFQVTPVDDGYYDGDQEVYINAIAHYPNGSETTVLGPYIIRDIHSSLLRIDCTNDVLDCGENRCFIALNKKTSQPVTVDLSVLYTHKAFQITPSTITFNGTDNLDNKEFKITYTKPANSSADMAPLAFSGNTLMVKTTGPDVYNNYEYTQDLPYYPQCQTVYDSRTSPNAAVSGLLLWPGVYKLEVVGAGGGSYFNHLKKHDMGLATPVITTDRGDGSRGSYATGVLRLTEVTKVYPWYGYGGKNGYLTSISCDPTEVNCGGKGEYSGEFGWFSCDGGGASDIRIGTNDLYHRVIVAAGGNGDGNNAYAYYYRGGYYYYTKDDVYGAPGKYQCGSSEANTASFGYGQDGYGGCGAGGGGWYGGRRGDGIYGNSVGTGGDGHGGRGSCGFVFRKNVPISSEALDLYQLEDKYMLTEYSGYDEFMPSDVAKPKLYTEAESLPDGVVKITALPKFPGE